MGSERAVYIRPDGPRFVVMVDPPLADADFTSPCDTHKQATSYAGMVGRLRRLPVVDESEAAQ